MSEELRTKEQQFRAVPVKGLTVPWKWSVQRRVQVLLARDLLVYEQRRSARSAGHVDKCSAPKAAADLPEVQHMTNPRLYCVYRDGERFWVFRFGRVGKRILDAIHVLRFGFMPS
jgi:hypothetical protein